MPLFLVVSFCRDEVVVFGACYSKILRETLKSHRKVTKALKEFPEDIVQCTE